MSNNDLNKAREGKKDEFYTSLEDVVAEIDSYVEFDKDIFRGKTVLLPCDDPTWSNFTKYFVDNFHLLGLKKLISTSYAANKQIDVQSSLFDDIAKNTSDKEKTPARGKILVVENSDNGENTASIENWSFLEGDGDFRSEEITNLRNEADFVFTNPPFSLFREFFNWLVEADIKFSIMGNMNAITYKEVFPFIKENKVWYGGSITGGGREFRVPEDYPAYSYSFREDESGNKFIRVKGVRWFTNIDYANRFKQLPLLTMEENKRLNKRVSDNDNTYVLYDNYDILEVPSVTAIPLDYDGVMGVPISYIDKHNPKQFEILGTQRWCKDDIIFKLHTDGSLLAEKDTATRINGKETYQRIFIKHTTPPV